MAEEMSAAFTGGMPTMSKSERIIELAEAQWVGRWDSERDGRLVLFRDPISGSTLALPEEGLTVRSVVAKLESKRKEFGRKS